MSEIRVITAPIVMLSAASRAVEQDKARVAASVGLQTSRYEGSNRVTVTRELLDKLLGLIDNYDELLRDTMATAGTYEALLSKMKHDGTFNNTARVRLGEKCINDNAPDFFFEAIVDEQDNTITVSGSNREAFMASKGIQTQ